MSKMKDPKEKANELVEKFDDVEPMHDFEVWGISPEMAIRCALVAVDYILESHKKDYELKLETTYWHPYDYWQQVKQEIERL